MPPCRVHLTPDAADDLRQLRKSGQFRAFLRELVRIDADPRRGSPLTGNLRGLRSARVGNRQWRIIYLERDGHVVVLAIGSRSDAAVYATAAQRITGLPADHPARDLGGRLEEIAVAERPSPRRDPR